MRIKLIKRTEAVFGDNGIQTLYEFGLTDKSLSNVGLTAGVLQIMTPIPDLWKIDREYEFNLTETKDIKEIISENLEVEIAGKKE